MEDLGANKWMEGKVPLTSKERSVVEGNCAGYAHLYHERLSIAQDTLQGY